MDFNLIRLENEKKVLFQVNLYQSTVDELRRIAEKEQVKLSTLARHCINNFVEKYRKDESNGRK